MDAVALGAVRRIERGDHFGGRDFCEIAHRPQRCTFSHEPVNATHLGTGARVDLREPLRCDPARVLDEKAIHVHDVERAVRAGARLHGAEPQVRAGEKFRRLFIVRSRAREGDAIGHEHFAMHEIMHGLAGESIPPQRVAEQRVAVNAEAASRSDAPRRGGIVEALDAAADREDAIRVGIRGDVDARRRRGDLRVSPRVVFGKREVEKRATVFATEPVAPIVAHAPVLREPGDGLERAGVRVHAEVVTANIHAADDSAEQTICAVNPIIQAEREAVDARLVVVGHEAGEEFFHHVGASVAIGVFGVNDVWRSADERPFFPRHHARWEREPVEKNGGLVETPVAVRVR